MKNNKRKSIPLPADGTGTSSLIEEYEKEADCTPSEIQKISLEAPRNHSVYAENQGIVPLRRGTKGVQ